MALSDSQAVDLRRWMGYPTLNAGETDYVFSNIGYISSISLTNKLAGLSAAEESTLQAMYLTPLTSLEAALLSAADNMDTSKAGPWEANPREMQERTALYNKWRRDVCGFLGFEPGPALGAGGCSIPVVRA